MLLINMQSLYCYAWLSKHPESKKLICTPALFSGMKRELEFGTSPSKYTIVQMMLNLHNQYDEEENFVTSVRDLLLDLMKTGYKLVCVHLFA